MTKREVLEEDLRRLTDPSREKEFRAALGNSVYQRQILEIRETLGREPS